MCNLYSHTKGKHAIIALARAMGDRTGNLMPLPGIFPDYSAPVVRNTASGRELAMARWGMPSPVFALKGKNADPGVTNVRNTALAEVGGSTAPDRKPPGTGRLDRDMRRGWGRVGNRPH